MIERIRVAGLGWLCRVMRQVSDAGTCVQVRVSPRFRALTLRRCAHGEARAIFTELPIN
jgi:hypothetical protein